MGGAIHIDHAYTHLVIIMAERLTPLEQEREEFGYSLEEIRGKSLRVIHRTGQSDFCVFFLHGGGGRACQFKHQIRALQDK